MIKTIKAKEGLKLGDKYMNNKAEEQKQENTPYSERHLIDEMIAHCPMLDRIDCIGLIEMVLQRYGRADNLRGNDDSR